MIRNKLKKRLLEIPINDKALRRLAMLSKYLNVSKEELKMILDELCGLRILEERVFYACPECEDIVVLNLDNLENESFITSSGLIECPSCMEIYPPLSKYKTGKIYYNILDKERLKNWN